MNARVHIRQSHNGFFANISESDEIYWKLDKEEEDLQSSNTILNITLFLCKFLIIISLLPLQYAK